MGFRADLRQFLAPGSGFLLPPPESDQAALLMERAC